jgi:hypothetical protein
MGWELVPGVALAAELRGDGGDVARNGVANRAQTVHPHGGCEESGPGDEQDDRRAQ